MILRRISFLAIVNLTQRCYNIAANTHIAPYSRQSTHLKYITDCHKLHPPPPARLPTTPAVGHASH